MELNQPHSSLKEKIELQFYEEIEVGEKNLKKNLVLILFKLNHDINYNWTVNLKFRT